MSISRTSLAPYPSSKYCRDTQANLRFKGEPGIRLQFHLFGHHTTEIPGRDAWIGSLNLHASLSDD
ncbi:unnamed protein product [Sphenostylis stenocarpa]|uniref:Uncharacterized protein n=1 Tax=Sphenostylis stenocarpa TaxID=92480 RepID=A0AA86SNR3_9FABA|nr:unnamed protein product [Sphenostylis stenocarpa]